LVVGANSTHGERLLVLFQVVLELVLNKSSIISVVSANIAAKRLGLAFEIMLGSYRLFSVGGQLKIDVTIAGGSNYENCSASVMVLAKMTFGLWDQSRLATFQLINVNAASGSFV
jgi:hypothetical protein